MTITPELMQAAAATGLYLEVRTLDGSLPCGHVVPLMIMVPCKGPDQEGLDDRFQETLADYAQTDFQGHAPSCPVCGVPA